MRKRGSGGPLVDGGGPSATLIAATFAALDMMAPVVEKEGGIEGLTEGVLLAWVVIAVRVRMPLALVASAILLLEEVDYGQIFVGYPTPEFVKGLSEKTESMSFHSIPALDPLWRLGSFISVWCLSGRWARTPLVALKLARLGVPTFATAHGFFAAMIAMALVVVSLRGDRVWDELHEVFIVMGAWALWRERRDAFEH